VSDSFEITPAAAAAVAFVQQPTTVAAGTAFDPAVSVSVRDAYGNLVTSATDSVTLQLTAGTGSLLGTTTVAASDGIATFTALTIEVAGTGKQLTATSGVLASAVSDSFAVTAASAAALAFVQQPTTTAAVLRSAPRWRSACRTLTATASL